MNQFLTKYIPLISGFLLGLDIIYLLGILLNTGQAQFYIPINLVLYINLFAGLWISLLFRNEVNNFIERLVGERFRNLVLYTTLFTAISFWIATLLSAFGGGIVTLRRLALIADTLDNYLMLLLIGLIFICLYFGRFTKSNLAKKEDRFKFHFKTDLIAGLIIGIFAVFAITNLGNFITVDEPKWIYNRVPQLVDALNTGSWDKTLINDKPGFLPALLSSAFLDVNNYQQIPATQAPSSFFWWRLPIALAATASLVYIYYLLGKFFNQNQRLLALAFIAFNPFILTISRIVNPDSMLWNISLIAALNFLLFLRHQKYKYLIIASSFQAIALLSKFTASVNFLIFFVLILYAFVAKPYSFEERFTQLKNHLFGYMILIVSSILLFAILLPFNWVELGHLAKGTIAIGFLQKAYPVIFLLVAGLVFDIGINKGRLLKWIREKDLLGLAYRGLIIVSLVIMLFAFINYQFGFIWVDVPLIRDNLLSFTGNKLWGITVTNYTFLIFSTPLVVLSGYLLFCIDQLRVNAKTYTLTSYINIVFILYTSATGLAEVLAVPRYQIMFLPWLGILAALGWLQFLSKFRLSQHRRLSVIILTFAAFVVLVLNPFAWPYTNPLNWRQIIVQRSWGFGGFEIADYLNSKPNPRELTVWSDQEGVEEFFYGTTYWRASDNPFFTTKPVDYLVLTPGGEGILRNALIDDTAFPHYRELVMNTDILDYYGKETEYTFCLDNNEENCFDVVAFP